MSAPVASAAQQAPQQQPIGQPQVQVGGAQQAPQTPRPSLWRRMVENSAQRIMLLSVTSALVSLLVAALGFTLAQNQGAGLDRASVRTERVLTVMEVRHALLEADGAATNAFLLGGLEPVEQRAVYDAAIFEAARLLTSLAEGADADDAELIASLNADLTTYTSLVEAARVNNRQGFPVGTAYLEQASTLVRETMLVDLDSVLRFAADDAAADLGVGNRSYPIMIVVVGALVVLVVVQVKMASLTRRRLNLGLVIATVLMLVATFAGGFASVSAANQTSDLRAETYRPTLAVAQGAVLAAEARTLESFTLIKRGSGAEYEATFVERTTEAGELLAPYSTDLAEQLLEWVDRHAEIRSLDDSGDWDGAVELAITDDEGSPSAAYVRFNENATAYVDAGSQEVTDALDDLAGSVRLASWVLLVSGLAAAYACWRGLAPRREEYR